MLYFFTIDLIFKNILTFFLEEVLKVDPKIFTIFTNIVTILIAFLVPVLIEVYKDKENFHSLEKLVVNKVTGFEFSSLKIKCPRYLLLLIFYFYKSVFT